MISCGDRVSARFLILSVGVRGCVVAPFLLGFAARASIFFLVQSAASVNSFCAWFRCWWAQCVQVRSFRVRVCSAVYEVLPHECIVLSCTVFFRSVVNLALQSLKCGGNHCIERYVVCPWCLVEEEGENRASSFSRQCT